MYMEEKKSYVAPAVVAAEIEAAAMVCISKFKKNSNVVMNVTYYEEDW